MALEIKLQGYIVKTQDLNEADLLLTFFSQESGKMRFIAKSAKKMMSKLRGRLQPNCLNSVTLTSLGSLPLVINSEVLYSYQEIVNYQDRIQAVQAMQEIILKALPDELPNQELFSAFGNALKSLNGTAEVSSLIVLLKFLNFALQALGFAPELLPTGVSLPGRIFYNLSEGKFKSEYLSAADQLISVETYAMLRALPTADVSTIPDSQIAKELFKILLNFLTYQLERDLKAVDYFLHEIV